MCTLMRKQIEGKIVKSPANDAAMANFTKL